MSKKAIAPRAHSARRSADEFNYYAENRKGFALASEAEAFAALVEEHLGVEMTVQKHAHHFRRNVRPKSQQRSGIIVLEFLDSKPGRRSFDIVDIAAHLEENHFSKHTAGDTIRELEREGQVRWIGTGTIERIRNDPTTTVRTDVELEATSDGNIARLEHSEASGCGCGDQGCSP